MYDGTCFKLADGKWKKCKIKSETDLEHVYASLPYEIDANKFAYNEVSKMFADKNGLDKLYKKFLPTKVIEYADLQKIFDKIDSLI